MSVSNPMFTLTYAGYGLDNDQAGMKKFARLLEAEWSAQAHSEALDAVKKELDRISLARTLSHSPINLDKHFQAAQHVRLLHNESQQRLRDLTAQIGLSDLKPLQNPSSTERDYMEKYILAQFHKHAILIRLAKYQDKMNPIQSSQQCGGQLVTKVGYSKMVSVFNSAKDRAHVISDQVAPSWLPDSLKHTKMDVKILLNMDPSDEQWTNMWESLWVSNWNLDEKPPAFIVNQQVCHGIVAVLSLARIEEEKLRLAREELNACTWIVQSVDSMIQTTDDIHPLYKYQWQLRLKLLLKCHDTIVNGPFPCINLWRASTHYLLANLEHSDPQARSEGEYRSGWEKGRRVTEGWRCCEEEEEEWEE
ncbi:uncharacterized protein EI90DRAFT_3133537 [Cantharellus anzutake]|uniref:uncharacterized protein n=1 Tax=Cantharellus anzutake TaxID=1750568 RepID=UPI001907D48E|nr:uncharacterized protein EI90DRAFT_3133537 [Cantharellus anzutake]KAF8318044.1 hypothetical protein EI90DRAFT_3133537 [Cantharellus anzutake]